MTSEWGGVLRGDYKRMQGEPCDPHPKQLDAPLLSDVDKPLFDKPLLHEDVVKPVTTNPGLPTQMLRVLEELRNIEYCAASKRMYDELLPHFAEERLLHVSGAEQIARQWHKRRHGEGQWDQTTRGTQELTIKVFAQLLNDGVIIQGPQLFRQVD